MSRHHLEQLERPKVDARGERPYIWPPMARRQDRVLELASAIDERRARVEKAVLSDLGLEGLGLALGVLACSAFPAVAQGLHAEPSVVADIARTGHAKARERPLLTKLLAARLVPVENDETGFTRELRRFTRAEKVRVALREILPRALGGADVDVTAAELSALADVTTQAAFDEALAWATRRFGDPLTSNGDPSTFVILGMGKLGGDELNAGSDIDLIYFYDSDEGAARSATGEVTLHEFWTRVAKRLTKTLEEVTMDGFVWRVDLRLRPEGGSGPLVNSVAAAERYYESFGRLWERAALLRARPVAGDLHLGDRLLESLSSFVWRKRIDPSIASEMSSLVLRARTELSTDAERDLKLGPGGIREAEFFAQTLQLVWGGKVPSLRVRNTLTALSRLEAKGLTTPKESAEVADAYLALRRAEHAVQVMSGVQTHSLPEGADLERVAKCLGFSSSARFRADLDKHRARVSRRFRSVLPAGEAHDTRFVSWLSALERGDRDGFRVAVAKLTEAVQTDASPSLADNLFELARHPDGLLGMRTLESFPGLGESLFDSVLEAADPAQAALYLRVFFSRVGQPAVYVRLAFSDPAALRRLTAVLGASAFVGDALANNPELGDMILFSREVITPEAAYAEVLGASKAAGLFDEDPDETLIGALRLAKSRLTLQVALAYLASELTVRQVTDVLSAVADASLEVATRRALGNDDAPAVGLSVVAMGKLGGYEVSFGSDLDVLFLYEPEAAPPGADAAAYYTRRARKVIALIGSFHGAGPGYELDMRLRPSGNQGLLVTSLEAFARYHGFNSPDATAPRSDTRAAIWERMALTRARAAAGDMVLGERAVDIAHAAAFAGGTDTSSAFEEIHRIRQRVEKESSLERRGVHDLKLGPGGLIDIEFVVQLQQIRAAGLLGPDRAPQVADTSLAIVALEALDLLTKEQAEVLRSAYRFLRQLELKIRVVRADGSHILEEASPMLRALARRMDVRDRPDHPASDVLLSRYRDTTRAVRSVYEAIVLGAIAPPPEEGPASGGTPMPGMVRG